MVFQYAETAHTRRHGPYGYSDYKRYKPWLRDEFCFRCVFCLRRERMLGGQAEFSIDHFVPVAVASSLRTVYENLVYACRRCNNAKLHQEDLLNPCEVGLGLHLRIQDGKAEGLTAEGRRFIDKLTLNDPELVEFRRLHLNIIDRLSKLPDSEAQQLLLDILGFPSDIPDLRHLRPPGNTRPEGIAQSYFAIREQGKLPPTY